MMKEYCLQLTKTISVFVFAVPAEIIDDLSSDDVTVQEGDTVVLVCNVTGVPRPDVTWYRRPANSKVTDKESKRCYPRTPFGPGKITRYSNTPTFPQSTNECLLQFCHASDFIMSISCANYHTHVHQPIIAVAAKPEDVTCFLCGS